MKCIICACLYYFILCFGLTSVSGQTLRTVALSGQQAPGTPDGVKFDWFNANPLPPRIDNVGRVFFIATLQRGPGVEMINDTGMWVEDDGTLELVAREFDNVPGYFQGSGSGEVSDFGVVFRDFMQPQYLDPPNPKLNGENQTLVRADIFGYDENEEFIAGSALYLSKAGALELVAGARKPAPGTAPPSEFQAFRGVALNSDGNVAFRGLINDRGYSEGIWTDVRGNLELVAFAGSQVPGMPGWVTFFVRDPVLNSNGKLAFGAAIHEPDPSSPLVASILAGSPGALNAIVREGDQAPGTPTGVTFDRFLTPSYLHPELDSTGRVLFRGEVVGPGVDDTNDVGFWLEDAGSISLVAREGDQAPNLPIGVDFIELSTPLFNSNGHIAIHSRLTGTDIDSTNDGGIWAGTPDSLRLIVQKGDPAPGLAGELFTQVFPAALSESGRLAVVGRLPGTVFGLSNSGIWAEDTEGLLQLIVKSGDMLEVNPGDFREVRYAHFGGFNDRGQVVFHATFNGPNGNLFQASHGVFVSNLVAIPEPSALSWFFACVVAIGTRRQR